MSWFEDVAGVTSVVSPFTALANGIVGNPAAERTFQQGDAFLNGGGGLALDAAGLTKNGWLADAAQAGYHLSHSMYSAGRGNFGEAGSELGEAALNTFSAATGGGLKVAGRTMPKVQEWLAKGVSARSTVKDAVPFVKTGGGPTEYTDPPPPSEQQLDGGAPKTGGRPTEYTDPPPPSEQQLDGGAPAGGTPDVGASLSSSTALPPTVCEAPALFNNHPAWMYAD